MPRILSLHGHTLQENTYIQNSTRIPKINKFRIWLCSVNEALIKCRHGVRSPVDVFPRRRLTGPTEDVDEGNKGKTGFSSTKRDEEGWSRRGVDENSLVREPCPTHQQCRRRSESTQSSSLLHYSTSLSSSSITHYSQGYRAPLQSQTAQWIVPTRWTVRYVVRYGMICA